MIKNLLLISFIILGFSNLAYAQVPTNAPSYPHPQGSTFTPVTVAPTLPAVNSNTALQAEQATTQENTAAESAVTQTQAQVNSTLNSTTTQQDLHAKTGTNTTYQNAGAGNNSNAK